MTNDSNDAEPKETAASLAVTAVLLAQVVHSLQSGLQGILTRAEILEDALSETATPAVDLRRESQELVRMIRIVTQSLNGFALIYSHQTRSELVDLEKVVVETIQLCQPMARQKGLSINYHVDPDLKAFVRASSPELGALFYNLLDNAIRYSFDASSTNKQNRIEIMLRTTRSGGKTVEIINQAAGMEPEEIRRALQGLPGRSKSSHTGFGLLIARQIAQSYDAEVSFESKRNKAGSDVVTTCVSFPAVTDEMRNRMKG